MKIFFAINQAPHIRNSTNSLNNFNKKKLKIYLGLTSVYTNNATVELYLCGGSEELFAATHLRFCPDCIVFGYHSPIHQLQFIDKCPLHGTKIVDSCTHCGRQKFMTISNGEFSNPYACNYCFRPFFTHIEQFLFFRYNNVYRSEVERCFNEISRSLALRKVTYGSFSNHLARVKSKIGKHNISKYIKNTSRLMSKLTNGDDCGEYLCIDLGDSKSSNETLDLKAIYRCVRRKLYKKTLSDHRKCVKWIFKVKASSCSPEASIINNLCRVALAFVLWRMYFEMANSPNELLTKRRDCFDKLKFEELLPSEISHHLAERYFAIMCLYIFNQCLSEASAMIDRGRLEYIQCKINLRPGPPISFQTKGAAKHRSVRIFSYSHDNKVYEFNRIHFLKNKNSCALINKSSVAWMDYNYSRFHPRS